jgi:hypothetical protein
MSNMVEAVNAFLFGDPSLSVFAVLDGASIPGLRQKFHVLKPEHVCLYRGELQPDMAEVAPYLVRVPARSELAEWIVGQGWGKHWGVFVLSRGDLHALRQHFRRFLTVHDDQGKPLLFRFYDPRVLRTYLPTCNGQELAAFFGQVDCFMLEAEDAGVLLRYRLASGALVAGKQPLSLEKKQP